jgi:ribosomal protein S18 acetylase RimI-like enzyme
VTAAELADILDACRAERVVFLIARCPVEDLKAAQAMEAAGFRLTDTLLYFARDLTYPLPLLEDILPRPVRLVEADAVGQIAAAAFHGYLSHYHADSRLDPHQCDGVYQEWAYNSCVSAAADTVLVTEHDGAISGFITLRRLNADEGDGPLYAVHPARQGRGIGRALMIAGMRWLAEAGVRRMTMSTQVTNRVSQKLWSRLGFEASSAVYTFHKWFDEG